MTLRRIFEKLEVNSVYVGVGTGVGVCLLIKASEPLTGVSDPFLIAATSGLLSAVAMKAGMKQAADRPPEQEKLPTRTPQ